jgi:hypothetical protein
MAARGLAPELVHEVQETVVVGLEEKKDGVTALSF